MHYICVTYFIDGILIEKDIDIVVSYTYLFHMYIYTPVLTDIDINRPWHDHVIMHDISSYFTMLNCLSMTTLITEIDSDIQLH